MYCEAVSFFIFESYSLFYIRQKEKYADISVFLFRKNSLFHKITRTPFHLLIDLTHIFANYSTGQQNGSANKPQGNQQRSPSRNCRTFYKRADSIFGNRPYNIFKGFAEHPEHHGAGGHTAELQGSIVPASAACIVQKYGKLRTGLPQGYRD